jgi:hypothetical protein
MLVLILTRKLQCRWQIGPSVNLCHTPYACTQTFMCFYTYRVQYLRIYDAVNPCRAFLSNGVRKDIPRS